ncbi:MAG: hypothetical protein A2342_05835 [Gallionellales bacterium RIFOXYB12_FULL_54_9]|nr:MAG: hypothetical protein A2342_05835 [Gallionellales bacterium RIFOXYB12_FULL_54_9]
MFDGLLIVDDQGVLLEANQAYARMSGYSVDELSGMHLVQLESREQSMNEIKAHIAKIITQGRDLFETRHRCKDGHEIEVEVSVSYIPDSRQFLAFYRDITERKRTEEKLQLTQFVSDHAPDCIFWIDEHARASYVNQAACHVLGYTQEELLAMSCVLDFAPDFPADGWPAHWQELKQQGSLTFETRHRRKDGSIFPVEISANLVRFGEKEFNIAYSRDITERKQIEADLRIAAVAFETQDAILITDIDAHIVRVNQAFSEVTGYSAEEVLGRNPRLMSSGRHERSFYIEMWQELQHTGSWAGEIWDKRKNGEIYPKWVSISAVRNELQETSHYVAIFSDITKRKQVEEEIHNLAFYDALTRLPNRRLFLDRLQTALNASIRRNDYGAVMFIDLDHFKALNDTFGHDYGDLLLLEVGMRVKSCVREMDTVARFGGDEFVVLIESFSNELNDAIHKVSLVAEKIREALMQPYTLKNQEYNSSSSIGICLYHGNEETLETLIEHADMAMYEVKRCGRNAVRFFDPGMQHSLAMHDALVKDLHHALTRQQFQLQYQIQVDKDNHPLGAEAFLRWMHPEHGTIMPGKFIKIAEESALIIDIDRWVLKSACKQLALWSQNDKTRDLILTVNISAKLFAQPDFVSEVDIILKMYQADPGRLKLELSERIVQSDLSSSIDKIRALRRLGCKLSIDNFGTVYSSLSFLKLLSPDQLKIHQEFVHNISLDVNDAQLAHIVIDYAKSLNLNVFAEGVETEQQQAFLVGQDCDIYQGYLFSRPVPIEEFEALL